MNRLPQSFGSTQCGFPGFVFHNRSNQLGSSPSFFEPEIIPRPKSLIEHNRSVLYPCSLQIALLSGSTVSGWDGTTAEPRRAASKSSFRNLHTRRLVPDNA